MHPGSAQTVPSGFGDVTATLRLVAAPGRPSGDYQAGVEIRLPAGAHTYWKNPGEAGVPPVFSFDGSENVADATVEFPVPRRIVEEGLSAFGYDGTVIFPVAVRLRDAARPAVLRANVSFAVCSKICVPQQASADLALPGGAAAGSGVEAALADVPKPATAGDLAALKIVPLPGMPKPSWLLTWSGASEVTDIFPVAPDGYVFTTMPRGAKSWTLTASSTVSGPHAGSVDVALTLARRGAPLVAQEALDVASAPK